MNFLNTLLWIYMLIGVYLLILHIYKLFYKEEGLSEFKTKFNLVPVSFEFICLLYLIILIFLLPLIPVCSLIDEYKKYKGGD